MFRFLDTSRSLWRSRKESVENRYEVGQKVHARSTLASNFNVSPETARKAINVLVDLGIMDVRHGSGAYIASKGKAQSFWISTKMFNRSKRFVKTF